MKKRNMYLIFGFVVVIAIIVLIILNPFKSKETENTYGCDEIMEQIDLCWSNREVNSQDMIECWTAPEGYKNICEELEYRDYLDLYDKCDRLTITYLPPTMLAGYPDKLEGMVSNNCPVM